MVIFVEPFCYVDFFVRHPSVIEDVLHDDPDERDIAIKFCARQSSLLTPRVLSSQNIACCYLILQMSSVLLTVDIFLNRKIYVCYSLFVEITDFSQFYAGL